MTDKQSLKFLKYVQRKKSVTRSEIESYFYKYSISDNLYGYSFCDKRVIQLNPPTYDMNHGGQYVGSSKDCFGLSQNGTDYLDSQKWFTWKFFVEKLFFSIIVSVIASIITTVFTLKIVG